MLERLFDKLDRTAGELGVYKVLSRPTSRGGLNRVKGIGFPSHDGARHLHLGVRMLAFEKSML